MDLEVQPVRRRGNLQCAERGQPYYVLAEREPLPGLAGPTERCPGAARLARIVRTLRKRDQGAMPAPWRACVHAASAALLSTRSIRTTWMSSGILSSCLPTCWLQVVVELVRAHAVTRRRTWDVPRPPLALAGNGTAEALDPARPRERDQRQARAPMQGLVRVRVDAIVQGQDEEILPGLRRVWNRFDGGSSVPSPAPSSLPPELLTFWDEVADLYGPALARARSPRAPAGTATAALNVASPQRHDEVAVTPMNLAEPGCCCCARR